MASESSTITELQLLISMYDASSVRVHDPEARALLESLGQEEMDDDKADLKAHTFNSPISLTLKIDDKLEIDIRIPLGYPKTEPLSAFCRLRKSQFNKDQEAELNRKLITMLKSEASGENVKTIGSNIFNLIDFCKTITDELESSEKDVLQETSKKDASSTKVCRIWIHSHHIYNKSKRKFLVDYARELNLLGFSCPGKPGFVCVEGGEFDCDAYWSRVRQLNWQKITLIQKDVDVIPAFKDENFIELSINKSDFIKYLDSKSLSAVIKEYLGF